MDFNLHGGSPSSSASSFDRHRRPNNAVSDSESNGNSSDPMHSWWESISKARSRIHLLSSLLPPAAVGDEGPLSSLADTDRPARSLLSSVAYSYISAAIKAPSAGSGDDLLCQWLYDTYLSSDPDLRLVVLSYIPLIASVYLSRIHHPPSDDPVFLAGFEAVFLAIYSVETKARNGKAITVSIPDLSQPSLYHSPRNTSKSSNSHRRSGEAFIGVFSPPLEPQIAVKSTKRACIVGVALDCYYKQISQMPNWSKLDLCKSASVWAGQHCPCAMEFDAGKNDGQENLEAFENDVDETDSIAEQVKDLSIEDERIPLPWELLQPVLRIIGHCLLGPLSSDDKVKNAASIAVRRLYARASHDLVPQAILATQSLIRLDKAAREAVVAVTVATTTSSASGSNANTPSKARKPEVLLVSK